MTDGGRIGKMDGLDTREWLLTNGLGSFASGTVCDARTRSYHGWLMVALDSLEHRRLLLSHLEASLEFAGQTIALGTNIWHPDTIDPLGYQWLESFAPDPIPTWIWGNADHWQLTRQLLMPSGLPTTTPSSHPFATPPCHRLLIHYRYWGQEPAMLRLRPLIGDRDYHAHQQQRSDLSFSQLICANQLFLQAIQSGKPGTPWLLRWNQGHYQPEETWYWNYYYLEDGLRGLDCLEDLFSPGYLTVPMQPGDSLTLEACVGLPSVPLPELSGDSFNHAAQAEQQRLAQQFESVETGSGDRATVWKQLLRAGDQFIVWQSCTNQPTILAGYHWFGDRTREVLLSLPGLALTTRRFSLARSLLQQLGQLCDQGLLPDTLSAAGGLSQYNSIDCPLWWIEMLGLYLEATQDWDFLSEQYAVVKQIYKAFTAGTLHNIRVDASDGLVTWDDASVALTWMNTAVQGQPVTPRYGKPIEVNALWYSALCWAGEWAGRLSANPPATTNANSLGNQVRRYTQQAEQVRISLQKFWNPAQNYLFDRMEPDDRLNPAIRPNAVLALSLHHCAFSAEQARTILRTARDRLLTPYGLRSLDPADRAYIGHYAGSPRQRDLASHRGTVWSWLLGSFVRAWNRFYVTEPLPLGLQPLLHHFNQQVCFGTISELFDGDPPHHPRGAIANTVAIAELIRIWDGDEKRRAESGENPSHPPI
jgi:4-alpha-glucanotransferase